MSLFNRAEIIDNNFITYLKNDNLPTLKTDIKLSQTNTTSSELISIFESQVLTRHMDLKARLLKDEGKCYYTIGSSGHEGNAVFGKVFPYTDTAFYIIEVPHFLLKDRSKLMVPLQYMIWHFHLWRLLMTL